VKLGSIKTFSTPPPVDKSPDIGVPLNAFSDLVRLVYLGATEAMPWQSLVAEIGSIMRANWVTFVLRPPDGARSGLALVWEPGHPARIATTYLRHGYALDLFVNLPPDHVLSLDETVDESELKQGEFYKQFLEPGDIGQMLGVDFRTAENIDCHFRLCRPERGERFSDQNRALVQMLLPHLKLAVDLHSQRDVMETERALYAGAVDRMLVGMVILDETGQIMKTTMVATDILKEGDGLNLAHGAIKAIYQPENRKLQEIIRRALATAAKWEPGVVEAIAITRPSGRAKLGLIVRGIPLNVWSEGKRRPSVAVMLRDPERKSVASQEILQDLFDFTPAEANLALLMTNGLALEEAADELNIRKNTARSQLRSIFSKTGVTRQTMLVRLILGTV